MTRKLKFSRIGGAAAIGFAVVIVSGNAIVVPAGMPLPGATAAEAAGFFAAAPAVLDLALALGPAAWVFATLFGAGALCVLRSGWGLAGFSGLIMQNVTFAGVLALRLALKGDSGLAPVLWPLHEAFFAFNQTFLAIALIGLSIGGKGTIRPWQVVLGLVAAALIFTSATLAPFGVQSPIGLIGWLLWVVWLVAWGVTLIRLPGTDEFSVRPSSYKVGKEQLC